MSSDEDHPLVRRALEQDVAYVAMVASRRRTEALLAELLPSVGGLHALADDGPGALADRRAGRIGLHRALVVHAPAGCMAFYHGTPARARAAGAPAARTMAVRTGTRARMTRQRTRPGQVPVATKIKPHA
jgi:hypothetical protein